MTELSDKSLMEIVERHRKATQGRWIAYLEGRDHVSGSDFIMTDGNDLEIIGASHADYDFIAHAKQDIPLLIAEIERLKRSLKE